MSSCDTVSTVSAKIVLCEMPKVINENKNHNLRKEPYIKLTKINSSTRITRQKSNSKENNIPNFINSTLDGTTLTTINTNQKVNMTESNEELMALLRSIKEEQCTKSDLKVFTDCVNKKLEVMEKKIIAQGKSIINIDKRVSAAENIAASAQYQIELEKQRAIKNNVSIFGIPSTAGEELIKIVTNTLNKTGCNVANDQILSCYRIKGNANHIIVVKLADFDLK